MLLAPIFGQLRRGPGDPTHRRLGDIYLRATRTPAGPALIKIIGRGTEVSARAWGEGAEWALDQLPRLVGEADDPTGFAPRPEHEPLVEAHRRYGHYRVGRTEAVFEALAPACIEQVVTGKEAFRAWRLLVREFGEPAPGPATDPDSAAYGMYLPPTPQVWSRVPSWRFLAAGVEQRRSRTLVRTAVSGRGAGADADRVVRGRGPGAAELPRGRARGPRPRCGSGRTATRTPGASATTTWARDITYALTGEALDDDACLEILEPYRGHRFRVQALLGHDSAGGRPGGRRG